MAEFFDPNLLFPPVQAPVTPAAPEGFMGKASTWLGDPQNQASLMHWGRALSKSSGVQNGLGETIANEFLPGTEGQIAQKSMEKQQANVANAASSYLGSQKPANKASTTPSELGTMTLGNIWDHPISALESPHIGGISYKENPDGGKSVNYTSYKPEEMAKAQAVNMQIASGGQGYPPAQSPEAAAQGAQTNYGVPKAYGGVHAPAVSDAVVQPEKANQPPTMGDITGQGRPAQDLGPPTWTEMPVDQMSRSGASSALAMANPNRPFVHGASYNAGSIAPVPRENNPAEYFPPTEQLGELTNYAANYYGLDPNIFRRMLWAESQWNGKAVSPRGAQGYGQIMPSTQRELGIRDPFNPQQNIMGAAKYLKQQLDTFDGDYNKALAAYNAGAEKVKRYGGIPPYEETINYVNKIMGPFGGGGDPKAYNRYDAARGRGIPVPDRVYDNSRMPNVQRIQYAGEAGAEGIPPQPRIADNQPAPPSAALNMPTEIYNPGVAPNTRGLTVEQILAVNQHAAQNVAAPATIAHTVQSIPLQRAQLEEHEINMKLKQPMAVDIGDGKQVMMTGHEFVSSLLANQTLRENAAYRRAVLEQNQGQKDALAEYRREKLKQEQEENAVVEQMGDAIVPGTTLTYRQAKGLGILKTLISQEHMAKRQEEALKASEDRQFKQQAAMDERKIGDRVMKYHQTLRAAAGNPLDPLYNELRQEAAKNKISIDQAIERRMQKEVGIDWKKYMGVRPGEGVALDPLGIRAR